VNSVHGGALAGSVRFAAPALQQSMTSQRSTTVNTAGRLAEASGHGIVLVQPNPGAGSVTSQRHPLVPASSLFLPPRVMMS